MLKQFRTKGQIIRNSNLRFFLLWTSATAVGYVGGGLLGGTVARAVGSSLGLFLSFALIGAALSLTQWLTIRTKILGKGWLWSTWLGCTFGGMFSSWASFQLSITYGDGVDLLVVYGCLRGLTIGLPQWRILRRYSKLADWWIVASTFSWFVGIYVGSFLLNKFAYFLILLVGAVYGALTGCALLLILRHRR